MHPWRITNRTRLVSGGTSRLPAESLASERPPVFAAETSSPFAPERRRGSAHLPVGIGVRRRTKWQARSFQKGQTKRDSISTRTDGGGTTPLILAAESQRGFDARSNSANGAENGSSVVRSQRRQSAFATGSVGHAAVGMGAELRGGSSRMGTSLFVLATTPRSKVAGETDTSPNTDSSCRRSWVVHSSAQSRCITSTAIGKTIALRIFNCARVLTEAVSHTDAQTAALRTSWPSSSSGVR